MATKALIGLAASAVLASGTAFAGCKDGHTGCKHDHANKVHDDRWTVGAFHHYIDADSDERNTDDSYGWRLTVGKPVAHGINLELGLGIGEFDVTDSRVNPDNLEAEEISLTLDALFFLWHHSRFQPYAELGIGIVNTELERANVEVDDSTDFTVDAGIGALYKITKSLSLRGDVRHRVLFWDTDVIDANGNEQSLDPDEWVANFGLVYALGEPPKQPVKAAPPPADDSDGDGTLDSADRCPGTPAGMPVDEYGCPTANDSDGDGVVDELDKCPNTPAGTKVDINGCPLPETVVIYFAFDSSALTAEAKGALDRVATNLNNKNFVIAIANCHADSTGTEEYNVKLSERRAAAVANYLVSKGVAEKQIRQRAYGETRPASSNDTAEGRAKNRRVEINLLRQ